MDATVLLTQGLRPPKARVKVDENPPCCNCGDKTRRVNDALIWCESCNTKMNPAGEEIEGFVF
ncbi:MAG: hypothetical protein WC737_00450 [Parcubacteria group bacterium]